MRCTICQHSWCWICGYPTNHFFHKLSGGGPGLYCDIIHPLFRQNSPWYEPILYILLFITFPILFYLLLIGAALFGMSRSLWKWKKNHNIQEVDQTNFICNPVSICTIGDNLGNYRINYSNDFTYTTLLFRLDYIFDSPFSSMVQASFKI